MARVFMTGAEIAADEFGAAIWAIVTNTNGVVSRDTSTKRTGNASWKYDSGIGNAYAYHNYTVATMVSASYYVREYICLSGLPSTTTGNVLRLGASGGGGTGGGVFANLTSSGKLQLINNQTSTQIGSDSSANIIADGTTWYRIELFIQTNANSQITNVELRLDGTTVASASGLTITTAGPSFIFGWGNAPGTSKVMYADDIALNDTTGAANNSWCGDGKVLLLTPTADGAKGAGWTAGAGGTSNLWDGVNNTPPVGVADASATNTSQAKCNTTTFNSAMTFSCPTWDNTIGVGSTLNALQALIVHGEDPATGTKAGTLTTGNPGITSLSFNFGNDQGAQGTYLGLWAWGISSVLNAPTITTNANHNLIVTVTSGTTATRFASVCLCVAYADYTPAAPASFVNEPYGNNFRVASRRASCW